MSSLTLGSLFDGSGGFPLAAVLSGITPTWCADLGTPDPTDDEISWWTQVFADIGKTKSRKQIIKWLRNPHSDSAEYSLLGNGICVNCGHFVLSGIAFCHDL